MTVILKPKPEIFYWMVWMIYHLSDMGIDKTEWRERVARSNRSRKIPFSTQEFTSCFDYLKSEGMI